MKKLYLLLVFALLGMISASAATFTAKVVVDHPERISLSHNYNKVENVGVENVFEFTEGEYSNSIEICASSDEYFIKSVKNQDGVSMSVYADYTTGLSTCNISWSYIEADDVFTVETASYADVRTSTCTINVDNAEGVRVQRGNSSNSLNLHDGENIIRFDPENEKNFAFASANYGRELYSVKRNGTAMTPEYGTYYIRDMADGDVIDVEYNYPDVDVAVKINVDPSLNGPEYEEPFIQSVTTDDGSTPLLNEAFTVKAGTRVTINMFTGGFVLESLSLNGQVQSFYGSTWSFVATGESNVDIVARAYGNINFIVNIDDPDMITLYDNSSYSSSRNVIALAPGRNELKVSEESGQISFQVNSGYYVDSFMDSDGYDHSGNASVIRVTEGSEFTVTGGKFVLDKKAVVYVDEITAVPYGYNFSDSMRNSYTLENGYNFIDFAGNFNPFMFSPYGWSEAMEVFVNGESYAPQYAGSTSYEFTIEDNDVIKIFLHGAPSLCDVTVNSDAVAPYSVKTDYMAEVAEPASFRVHKGTHLTVVPEEKDAIVVMNGENTLTADDEGVFHIDVDAATALRITDNESSGIECVSPSLNEKVDVYNLQGVMILRRADGDEVRQLPAGMYIVGGRKVFVR